MNDFSLQTELTEEARRGIGLKAEKLALESEIQEQEGKIKKYLHGFFGSMSLLILVQALLYFFWQHPVSIFFWSVLGILNLIQAIWLFYGWRRKRQKLAKWTKIVN